MMHFKTIDLVSCWCRWNGHVQTLFIKGTWSTLKQNYEPQNI